MVMSDVPFYVRLIRHAESARFAPVAFPQIRRSWLLQPSTATTIPSGCDYLGPQHLVVGVSHPKSHPVPGTRLVDGAVHPQTSAVDGGARVVHNLRIALWIVFSGPGDIHSHNCPAAPAAETKTSFSHSPA